MYEWRCPHCGGREYSASPHRDEEKIRCIYCGREYANPYYKEGANGDE